MKKCPCCNGTHKKLYEMALCFLRNGEACESPIYPIVKEHCGMKIKDIHWSAGFGTTSLSSIHCLFSWGEELGLIKSKAEHPIKVIKYTSSYFLRHKNKFYAWKSKVGWNGSWAYIYQEPEQEKDNV